MSLAIHLPSQLRRLQGAPPVEDLHAESIKKLIDTLDRLHPGMAARLCLPDGSLRPLSNLFFGGTNTCNLQGIATRLREGSKVYIIPAVAGGRVPRS